MLDDEFDLTPAFSFTTPSREKKIRPPKRLRRLNFESRYKAHMKSYSWARFRAKIISDRKKCEHCGADNVGFHVHHITYARFGREKPADVRLLCVPCHERFHGKVIGKKKTA